VKSGGKERKKEGRVCLCVCYYVFGEGVSEGYGE